jgi:ribonuclease HII
MKLEEKWIIRLKELKAMEDALRGQGLLYIGGVDEVGRGPLAGPVVAACVVLPEDFDVLGIDDSKKVTQKRRETLCEIIKEEALAYGIGQVDNKRIDNINILEATKIAMVMAIMECDYALTKEGGHIEHLLIDGTNILGIEISQTPIIKGDSTCLSVAAASIVAKVTRDLMMGEYHKIYPAYGFDKNKGYGTKIHYEGLAEVGPCEIHRKSFLKNNGNHWQMPR